MSPRTGIRVDVCASIVFAGLAAYLIYLSNERAADAIRRVGHNTDSGVLELLVVEAYLAPVALLFAAGAVSFWRNWRVAPYVHWFAVLCAVVPVAMEAAGVLPD